MYVCKETVSNVDPSIYDAAFTIENGQMVMQTDLSLNGHRLRDSIYDTVFTIKNGQMVMQADLSLNRHRLRDSIHYIYGILNTKDGNTFLLNGFDNILVPRLSRILTIKLCDCKPSMRLPPVSLKIKHGGLLSKSNIYTSTQDGPVQTISINLLLPFGFMTVELASVVKDEELLLLIEYRVP